MPQTAEIEYMLIANDFHLLFILFDISLMYRKNKKSSKIALYGTTAELSVQSNHWLFEILCPYGIPVKN